MRDIEPVERLDLRGTFRGRHPKGNLTSLRVTFETPFALWCSTCPNPTIIGERTKFNAEKTTISSSPKPIQSYRMKHILCGGVIEIRTKPEGGYEVAAGARKKQTKDGVVTEDDFTILTTEELAQKKAKAFAILEYQAEEAEKQKKFNQRTLDLYEVSKQSEYPFMPKRELEALRISRQAAAWPSEDLDTYPPEAPPMARAEHMKEIEDIMRKQKKTTKAKAQENEVKVKRANKAFATSVRRNTRAKLNPFRNASSEFGRSLRPRKKRRRLIEGLQPEGAGDQA